MSEVQTVKYTVGGGIIAIDNLPVSALGPGVREGIPDALAKGHADPAVEAFVLVGGRPQFRGGRGYTAIRRRTYRLHPHQRSGHRRQLQARRVVAIHGDALGGMHSPAKVRVIVELLLPK